MMNRRLISLLTSLILSASAIGAPLVQLPVFAAEQIEEETAAEGNVREDSAPEQEDETAAEQAAEAETPVGETGETDSVSIEEEPAETGDNQDAAEQSPEPEDQNEEIIPDEQPLEEASSAEEAEETEEDLSETEVFTDIISIDGEGQTSVPEDQDGESTEELFSQYVDNAFHIQSSSGRRKARKNASAGLTGIDSAIYGYIAGVIPQIAAGDRPDTVFVIPAEDLGLEKISWTAEELGVPSVLKLDDAGEIFVDENGYASITDDAAEAVSAKTDYNLSRIIQALLADYPYELYWYDKTASTSGSNYGMTAYYDEDAEDYVLALEGEISISFPVAEEYSAGEYSVNTEIGQSVQTAVVNADAIIDMYRYSSDSDKLTGYKERICDYVSYNDEAAAGGISYGNPWQLIWVFDGDPSTNVVCEGYAKAFKYLCDQTAFDGDISCITVTGTMDGGTGAGEHMWNIVNPEDGKNYLVDVTNCDDQTVGAPNLLFLAKADSSASDSEYSFDCDGRIVSYVYDADTLELYDSEDLHIALKGEEVPQEDHETSEWLSEYTYTVADDTIVLTAYIGADTEITVPGSAKIDGTLFSRVVLSSGMWNNSITRLSFESGVVFPENSANLFANMNALESIDLQNADTSDVTSMGFMFENCNSLTSVDLSMLDTSKVSYCWGIFAYCNALNSVVLPANMPSHLDFPAPFMDENGNLYSTMPQGFTGTVSLTRAEVSPWLEDYNFELAGDRIVLTLYKGNDANIVIHGSATVGGKEFNTVSLNSWGIGRQAETVSFEQGVVFPSYCGFFFSDMPNLTSVDLSNVDTSEVKYANNLFANSGSITYIDMSGVDLSGITTAESAVDMFKGCDSLRTILAPTGLRVNAGLNGIYLGSDGNSYSKLPQNLSSSIVLLFSESFSGDPASGDPASGDPASGDPASGDPASGDPVSGDPASGDPASGDPASGDPASGDPASGDPASGDPEEIQVIIIEQPGDVAAKEGQTVSFHVEAEDSAGSDLTYQWYWSKDGTTWRSCTSDGYNTNTFSFKMRANYAGRQYRCMVSNGTNSVFSRAAELTLGSSAEIITQPSDINAKIGDKVTFTIEAEGENLTYQWQYSKNGTTWTNCTSGGFNTDTFGFTMKASFAGREYRCVVTSGEDILISDAATVSLKTAAEITEQPVDTSAKIGEQITLHVEAEGENLTYQWQWSKNGSAWTNCTSGGYNTDTFSFKMSKGLNGRQYRCVVTSGGDTLVSDTALISIRAGLEITEQPEGAEAAIGERITLHVAAEGENLTYQWQWSKNGATWTNCTSGGYNTDTFSFKMSSGINGRMYRCRISDGTETVDSEAAHVSIGTGSAITITAQPEDVTVQEGEQVSFHVEAEGEGLTYQWQYSKNGTSWINCTSGGYNTDTFGFKMKTTYAGRQYRCVVSSGSTSIASTEALVRLSNGETTIDGVVYKMVDNTMTVVGYTGNAETVVVQETVNGINVTTIGESAFEGKMIKEIDLPDTIQVIEKRAFANCSRLSKMY